MTTCDVLIVGGGPAGSVCAWRLRRRPASSVIVVDASTFPRDKVCAGWISTAGDDRARSRYNGPMPTDARFSRSPDFASG